MQKWRRARSVCSECGQTLDSGAGDVTARHAGQPPPPPPYTHTHTVLRASATLFRMSLRSTPCPSFRCHLLVCVCVFVCMLACVSMCPWRPKKAAYPECQKASVVWPAPGDRGRWSFDGPVGPVAEGRFAGLSRYAMLQMAGLMGSQVTQGSLTYIFTDHYFSLGNSAMF